MTFSKQIVSIVQAKVLGKKNSQHLSVWEVNQAECYEEVLLVGTSIGDENFCGLTFYRWAFI
jgi:hypothetical protein